MLGALHGHAPRAIYEGYGSCPLTVDRGKIVLSELAFGGTLDPTIPLWMVDGRKPTRAALFLKEKMPPAIYFDWMLQGRETPAKPKILPHRPAPDGAQATLEAGGSRGKAA